MERQGKVKSVSRYSILSNATLHSIEKKKNVQKRAKFRENTEVKHTFQRYVHSKMASNVVSLDSYNCAVPPVAGKAQVIGRLASNMVVGEMNIELFWIVVGLGTVTPSTLNVLSHRISGKAFSRLCKG
jgi:hypothetical protein